jgi:hypothetical protein
MSHNPEPFLVLTKENRDSEMMNFVVAAFQQVKLNEKEQKPVMMFVKWELPTVDEAETFLKDVTRRLQIATKHVFGKTLHHSQLRTVETKDNQLDLLFGIGIDADMFEKILRQLILSLNSKDGQLGKPPQAEESQSGETAADQSGHAEAGGEAV